MTSPRTRASNGRSSIYQDAAGTWHGYVSVGTRPDGRDDRRHRRGKTRAAVTAKVRELEAARDSGAVARPGRGLTVAAYLAGWLESSRGRVRVKTWVGYEVDVRLHVAPVIGARPLAGVTPEDIERVYAAMIRGGARPGTVQHARRTLSK